ncbi:MAG: caspase domain-containing protein, partial [Hyphomicrobiaceae bacterium]
MTDERGTDWQGTPPAPALSGERRVALVIGNGAYTQSQAALRNPRNDAEAFAKRLQEVNPAFDVTMALDVGRDAMEDALEKFEARLTNCDTALLFFAGHGLQVKGMNFLLPVDADIRQEIHLRRRAFSLNEVLEIMGRRVRRSSLVFLDACRDNPFARSLLAGLPAPEQARFMARSGLAEVKAGKGTFIAFATAPDNVALDGALGSTNSPFTAALVEHMAMPNVSINDMMTAVTRAVLQTTGDQQEPWIQSSLRERFCFHEPPAAQQDRLPPPEPQLAAQPVDDRTLEHAFWLSVERSTDPVELEAFLDRFPAGVFSKLAQERLNAAIYVASTPDPLRRALRRFPESPRAQAFRSAIARLEWARLEKSRDVEA